MASQNLTRAHVPVYHRDVARIVGRVLGLLGVLGAAAGCGGGGAGGTLDCAWLAGDNCWKQAAAGTATCLPPADETGVLSADNKTCTYAGGETITFAAPLTLPIVRNGNEAPPWHFTVGKTGAGPCLTYDSDAQGTKVVVGSQTVSVTRSGPTGMAVICPDGSTYSNPDAFSLLQCAADGGVISSGLPGFTYSSSATSVRFGLLGATESLLVFDCEKPQ
jgi:hypothetical protein